METELLPDQVVPIHIQRTLDWLIHVEDFVSARSLAYSVYRFLPQPHPVATDFLASVLHRSKFYREAADVALQTLKLIPDSPEANFNGAKCLNNAGRPAEAEIAIRRALSSRPNWLDAQIDLAVYVGMQGRHDEAMDILVALAARIPPESKDWRVVQFNLGWHWVRKGKFKEGMRALALGRNLKIWGAMSQRHAKPMLKWGESVRGRTVLISGEGGAGDEIIAARFATLIRDRGGRSVFASSHSLTSLFARCPALDGAIDQSMVDSTSYDVWIPAMDLPQALELDLSDVPSKAYLSASVSYCDKWEKIVKRTGRLRVGLRWQGNALYEQDLMRSVPFRMLEGLASVPGVELYSLQRDSGLEELTPSSAIIDLESRLETWEDTAGAIAQLDLVISSCTSVAHLAGAMGKTVWLLCPLNCYYVWATPGDYSPWYPDLRLFRQTHFGDWAEPMGRIRKVLEEVAHRKP